MRFVGLNRESGAVMQVSNDEGGVGRGYSSEHDRYILATFDFEMVMSISKVEH